MSNFMCPKSNGLFDADRSHTIRLTRSPKPENSLPVECFGVWLPVESKSSVLPAELRSSRFSVEDSRLVRRNVKLLLRPKRDLRTQACYNETAEHFSDQLSLYVQTLCLTPFPIPLVAYCSGYTFSFKGLGAGLCLLPLSHPTTPKRRRRKSRIRRKRRRSTSRS